MVKGLLLSLVVSVLPAFSLAQTPSPNYKEVFVSVTVNTDKGAWITDLTKDDFEILINKQPQTITHFSSDNDAVAVGFLIDISGSTEDVPYKNIVESLNIYINKASSKNENFLMVFSESQSLLVPPTNDKQKMLDSIREIPSIILQGNTKFFDSLKVALDIISKSSIKRKTLIIISDMMDNSSKIGFSKIKEELKRSDCIIYGLTVMTDYPGTSMSFAGHAYIDELSKISGGRAYYPLTTREVSEILYRIAEDLEYQYLIGFTPTQLVGKSKKDDWRTVDVKVKIPSNLNVKKKPVVRFRRGFYPIQQTD